MTGGSTTTKADDLVGLVQGNLLMNMAPYIMSYASGTLPQETKRDTTELKAENAVLPSLVSQLTASATGVPSSQDSLNTLNSQQQMRQQAGIMNVQPGDPRLAKATATGPQTSTVGGMTPEVSTILNLFGSSGGLTPANVLNAMSGHATGSTTTSTTPGIGQDIQTGASAASTLAMLGYALYSL